MPLINFQRQFALPVLHGLEQLRARNRINGGLPREVVFLDTAELAAATFTHPKRQTIRAIRKRGNPKKGSLLYLYTGARTKACRKLGADARLVCRRARPPLHRPAHQMVGSKKPPCRGLFLFGA